MTMSEGVSKMGTEEYAVEVQSKKLSCASAQWQRLKAVWEAGQINSYITVKMTGMTSRKKLMLLTSLGSAHSMFLLTSRCDSTDSEPMSDGSLGGQAVEWWWVCVCVGGGGRAGEG